MASPGEDGHTLTLLGGPLDGASVEVLVDLGRFAEFVSDPPEEWVGVDEFGNVGPYIPALPAAPDLPLPGVPLRTAIYRWEKRKARRLGVLLQWEILVSEDVKRNRLGLPPN